MQGVHDMLQRCLITFYLHKSVHVFELIVMPLCHRRAPEVDLFVRGSLDDEAKHRWPGSKECFHRAVPVLVLRPATLQYLEPVVAAFIDSSDNTFDIFLALLAQQMSQLAISSN